MVDRNYMNHYRINELLRGRNTTLKNYLENCSVNDYENTIRQLRKLDLDTYLGEVFDDIQENISMSKVTPSPVMKIDVIARKKEIYKKKGMEIVNDGKVAAIMLAGGHGSRLGFEHSKGMYNLGISKCVYIFELLVKRLIDAKSDGGKYTPLCIMTNQESDNEIRKFFSKYNNFGYPESHTYFFKQEHIAATDKEGNIIVADDGILETLDGNGGWLKALKESGVYKELVSKHVEWFNVFSVDNVLQSIADPVFLGATIENGYDCAAKVVKKMYENENVGIVCNVNGVDTIIEYYDLPDQLKRLRDDEGNLVYNYGVILNYLFRRESLEKFEKIDIPWHKVKKKLSYTQNGKLVKENGYKYEKLIIDMLKEFNSFLSYEIEREKEFAPVKNLIGRDSVESARELLISAGYSI